MAHTQPMDVRGAWKFHAVYFVDEGQYSEAFIWAADMDEAITTAREIGPVYRALVVELDEVGPFPQYKHP